MAHYINRDCDAWALLECLVSSVHQGITVVDKDLNIDLFNNEAIRLLDLSPEIVAQTPTFEGLIRYNAERGDYGPGDPDEQVAERIAIAKKFEPHDFVRERPDGTRIRIQGTPMSNGGFVTIYTDVTEEYRQKTELEDARERLEGRLSESSRELDRNRDLLLNAINAISDGLGIANPRGEVILANDKMRKIYPRIDEFIDNKGSAVDVIRTVFPEKTGRNFENDDEGPFGDGEWRFPDGRWYKVTRTRASDGSLISVYSDVTSYKEQHAVLQSHTDELIRHLRKEKKLTEMQREFVSMASHEFRTPLAIIDSNAQRMARKIDKLEPTMVMDRITNIRQSVERMQYLITRFLNFSQSQSGEVDLQTEDTAIRDLVDRVCRSIQSVNKNHDIHIDISDLPENATLDPKLFEHCLNNIISNAIKYSPERKNIWVTGSQIDGSFQISVRDEGVGIPTDEIPKIFNRYFRASTSSGIAGTGIGLNMTEMIIQKHNGKVDVDSQVGEGTTVTMTLPTAVRAAA
ncbi:PAS-domain containing protein [Labrenzia sp. PHM005]|uniref:sensor histidine kinase n=1 Tax=Labrenzia sp. PHM005 TaxID=2590016 RepID=UPI00113FF0F8|nr:PAS-domain containing protein [Labrenzia sp. PHM005]QDG78471.1 hypothetical protein FJ695_22870 [Labrenzia sp. PHM005]